MTEAELNERLARAMERVAQASQGMIEARKQIEAVIREVWQAIERWYVEWWSLYSPVIWAWYTKVRRGHLYARLRAHRMPHWLARWTAGHCPAGWLPQLVWQAGI